MAISLPQKNGISEQVFQDLKQMIFERKWAPGDRLPSEQTLCDMFGVSRVSIRNALHRLKAQGLIETQLGAGSYVKQLDVSVSLGSLIPSFYLEDDFETILEFRREMESGAAALAAHRAEAKHIVALNQLLEKMKDKQEDLEALALLDFEFHYAIAQATKNKLIIKTYEVVHDVYFRHMKQMVQVMGGSLGVYYHGEIVNAITNKDANQAREMMHEHIHRNFEFLT